MKIHNSIEHLFRHEYGKITAALTSKFSSYQIDLIEDSVQEALLKAMKLWSFQEMPENPSAWLYRVASNHLIDQLRRAKKSVEYDFPENFLIEEITHDDSSILSGIKDEQLKMIFACCHPILNDTEQIILSLKLISGFGIKEISSALLKNEEAVKKAITRAKLKFKNEIGKIEVPNERELNQRLNSVLKVIYLIFNEGYKSTGGETLVKKDVCLEAIRLAEILTENKICDVPQLNALLSLMCFNAARFEARINENEELVTLENQNRNLWDKELINAGMYYLDK
ncbi:MAG: sigma-70 family RNA polymerase sigma factor, partial [Melioribacteraceae bacterium]